MHDVSAVIVGINLQLVNDSKDIARQIIEIEDYECRAHGNPNKGKDGKTTVWVTPAQLNRMALDAGFETVDSLRNAITDSLEDCYLQFTLMECEEGEPILADDGVTPVNDDVYTSDWLKVLKLTYSFALSERALEYLREINTALDMQDARAARTARNTSIAKIKSRKPIIIKKDDDAKDDDDVNDDVNGDDDAIEGIDVTPTLTAAQMKAANKTAKAAGQPLPYPTA